MLNKRCRDARDEFFKYASGYSTRTSEQYIVGVNMNFMNKH